MTSPVCTTQGIGCVMEKIRQIILVRRPTGIPVAEDFALTVAPMPRAGAGEVLVKMRVGSVDPAIRGFLDDRPSYLPPVALGAPINGMSLGEVIESNNAAFPVGTLVRAFATWSDHYVIDADALGLEVVRQQPGTELHHYMGALGPVGLTAWIGLFAVGEAKPGETVVVSAAAGATGSSVGQIAKARGCKVIGLVGSSEKAALIRELGFDAAIDYRATPDIAAEIAKTAPDGVDVYFDNVGGAMLEAILPLMRLHGRVAVCGMIGQYNDADHPHGVKTLWQMVVNRLKMQGFITYDYPQHLEQAQRELDGWVADGKLKPLANLRDGFEKLPEAFIDLMSGRTMGKTLVRI
jgi:NADPH-dependent curcumin reductase CurA